MGNRAVIEFEGSKTGVYLHWNGGRDSVEAFLEYCKLREFRPDDYGIARFTQVVANFLGGSLSVGVGSLEKLDRDNGDNGVYVVKDWQIVGRKFFKGKEQQEYNREEMLLAIDEQQPQKDQIGKWLKAKKVSPSKLKIGDKVVFKNWNGCIEEAVIVGIGDCVVNGDDKTGKPYCNFYGKDNPKMNPNNYNDDFRLFEESAESKADESQEETENGYTITVNTQFNSIEISFTEKPTKEIRDTLKALKFRWHGVKKVWYGYSTEDTAKKALAEAGI